MKSVDQIDFRLESFLASVHQRPEKVT